MKHEKELQDFLEKYININKTRLDNAREKTNPDDGTLISFLKNNTDKIIWTAYQWSFSYKTIIKPNIENDNWEYDVDVAIKMKYNEDWDWNEKKYHEEIIKILENSDRYKDKLNKKKERAIRVHYTENDWEFYVDLVPMFQKDDKWYVINRKDNLIEISWWFGFRDWVNKQNNDSDKNLKKVIRIFKFLKNQVNPDIIRSVQLTLLLARQVSKYKTEDFESISDSLMLLSKSLKEELEKIADIAELDLSNPALKEEKFDRGFDNEDFLEFKNWFIDIAEKIEIAFNETDSEKSIEKWKEIFGENFNSTISKSIIPCSHDLYFHAQDPYKRWKKSSKIQKIDIKAYFLKKEYYLTKTCWVYSWQRVPKNIYINFFAKLPENIDWKIIWQVTNENNIYVEHKRWELWNQTKELYDNKKWYWIQEETQYPWQHWVKCYWIKDWYIIWESERFYIKI